VTNTAAAIANEKDWGLVTGPGSVEKLPNQFVPITVQNGQKGLAAQKIDLYVRHPLLVYGQLRFKDPEAKEKNFPKNFYVAAYSGAAKDADTEVAKAKLDAEGKFNFEIDRKWDWFTFKFGSGKKKFINVGKTEDTELRSWRDRKELEREGAKSKFFSPPESWWLIESVWDFSEQPKYIDSTVSYKPVEGKIHLFDPATKNWLRRIGEKGNPVKMVLDPHWQFMRHEYFDRYYGHENHNHERVNMPTALIDGYWGKGFSADPTVKLGREGSGHWTLEPDDIKKSVHCVPWVRQKDEKGKAAEKPDKDALLQFEMPKSTFAVSKDENTRKYEQIGASSSRLKASADRLKLYDMPEVWKSKGYWARYLTAAKAPPSESDYDAKFWEDWDQPGYVKSRTMTTPIIFSLDDIVLTDSANVPLQDIKQADKFAIMYHRFKKDYDEQANLSNEGVYNPYAKEKYFSDVDRKGTKFHYIAKYPNWVRAVAGNSSCFDAFDQRTSQEVFGARAAVRWYDGLTGTPAAANCGDDILDEIIPDKDHKYFVIGPEWGQQHPKRYAKFVGSKTAIERGGRFDMVLLRCCDVLHAKAQKELFINLHYIRLTYVGIAGSVYTGNEKDFYEKALPNLMARWNGNDVNTSRAELVPQDNKKPLTGEFLYFLQPSAKVNGAHFKVDIKPYAAGGRASMTEVAGIGEMSDKDHEAYKQYNTANAFVAAHEFGHAGSLPDEYAERAMYCSHGTAGVIDNTPSDHFVDEGLFPDLAVSLSAANPANPPYPVMSHTVDMRNRYFWHNAEFARKHTEVPFYSKHGGYDEYKVPGHPKFPIRNYVYWPVRKKMNRKKRSHGAADVYLHVLGKEKFTQNLLPPGNYDGMVSVLVKIDLTVLNALDVNTVRNRIRNAFLGFNQQFSATGSTGVKTDKSRVIRDNVKFAEALVRFSPRFLISNTPGGAPDPNYTTIYNSLQNDIGSHFQITVTDNKGKVGPAVVNSGFVDEKKGGAMNLGVDSALIGWEVLLQAKVEALIPEMLGIKPSGAGGVIKGKDLNSLVGSVIHSNAKVLP
jgi:hypothetical protein